MSEINYNSEKKERGNSALAIRAGFWYVLGNFTAKAITFITTPIFARLMSPHDYGEFSNFASWALMLTLIVSIEMHNSLSRAYYDFKEDYDDYISSATILGGITTAVFYFFFLWQSEVVLKVATIQKQYIHLLFGFLFFSFCRTMFYARERTLYRYKTVAVITFLSLFVPTIVSVVLVYVLPQSNHLSARLYGFYLTSAIIGIYCFKSLFTKSRVFKWHYCKYALFLSIPLLVHYLTGYLLTSTNVIITKNILGASVAAVVSLAHSVIHILTVLFHAIAGALTTWIMDNLELGNRAIVRKGGTIYTAFITLVTISIILFTPEVVYILGGEKYFSSIPLIPGLAFASCVQAATTIFTIILTYDKNIIATAIFTGIASLISIVAKVYLLPEHGYISLVYVNIAIFSALFLINYFLVKKAGYVEVVSLNRLLAILSVAAIATFSSQYLYSHNAIRYMVVAVILLGTAVIIIRNKDKLINFMKKHRKKKDKNCYAS